MLKKYTALLIIAIIAVSYSYYKLNLAKSAVSGIKEQIAQIEEMSKQERVAIGVNDLMIMNMAKYQSNNMSKEKKFKKMFHISITILLIIITLILYEVFRVKTKQ